jgi:catechol 2,3-dioxygenase-like lactoylglutathione lyase family enzyme
MIGFVATANLARAKHFYGTLLGLPLTQEELEFLQFELNGMKLRISQVDRVIPAPFTVLGWEVINIHELVDALQDRGVPFERFEGAVQDDLGIWRAPGGAWVAWFRDPDGNLLSLTQF